MARNLKPELCWSGNGQTRETGGPSLPYLRGDDDTDNTKAEMVPQVSASFGVGKGRDPAVQKESGEGK